MDSRDRGARHCALAVGRIGLEGSCAMAMPATVISRAAPQGEGAAGGGGSLPVAADGLVERGTTLLGEAYLFLTPHEATFVAAVVGRMISGMIEVGVPEQLRALDRLLARSLDHDGARNTMVWGGDAGADEPLAVRFRTAVQAIDRYCRGRFGGRDFAELPPDEQDEVLAKLEMGEVVIDGLSSKAFYNFLLEHSIRAYFGAPDEEGDRQAEVWRLIGFLSSFSTVIDAA